jgi:AraC-like DNA-binding protein
MVQSRIVVLSDSASIIEKVRSAGNGASVVGVECLVGAGAVDHGGLLIIDPGAVHPCCLERLGQWSRRRPLRRVVYLCLPAPAAILFSLPQVHPGTVAELRDIETALRRGGGNASARSAWRDLQRLLIGGDDDDRRQSFLALARGRHPRGLTASQAADSLGVGVRHLSRLIRQWFGYPPRVVLGLFRIECLAGDLRRSGARLTELALLHGYATRQGMSRHFQAYTGITPGAYRFAAESGHGMAGERLQGAAPGPKFTASRPALHE